MNTTRQFRQIVNAENIKTPTCIQMVNTQSQILGHEATSGLGIPEIRNPYCRLLYIVLVVS